MAAVYLLITIAAVSTLLMAPVSVSSHGRLMDPVGRSSMWRLGYPTLRNYDDDQLYCGGFSELWNVNHGECGVCGDDYSDPTPRDNEAGGKYGRGIIVRNYTAGQEIDVYLQITTNHKGYFEFRICPHNDFTTESSQECLDQHLLEFADGSGTRFNIPWVESEDPVDFHFKLMLPSDVTCFQCLFQWHWWTASNWGICPDGLGAQGCGPQEIFRGCADIAITASNHKFTI